jgi:UDP-glucose 4-epimerase
MGVGMTDAVIVFGANGFVGRHLVSALSGRGESVIALTRDTQRAMPAGVEVHAGEFAQPEDFLPLLSRARAVIHVASRSTPSLTAGRPLAELDANLRPTLALIAALQDIPRCELLYVSSGGTLYGDTHEHIAGERDAIAPRSYHGAGKAAAEHFIHAGAMQYGLATTILRPSNLYGPGQDVRTGFGIVPAAFERIRNGAVLTLWGDGSAVRDYLYIEDFIRLCLAVLARPMPCGVRTFNAASGEAVSLDTLIEAIRRATGAALPVVHDTSRAVDVSAVRLDVSRVARETGWAPLIDLDEGLRRTWAWWQTQA